MINVELNRQLRQLRELISKTSAASSSNLELQAHWARYLCVLVAGLFENAVQSLYGDFVSGAASEPVARFAVSSLGRITNPKAGRFVEIARSFKESWASALESFLRENGRGDAIDSIMANRHQIVHGGYSGITVARVADYLQKGLEVLEFIENQCIG